MTKEEETRLKKLYEEAKNQPLQYYQKNRHSITEGDFDTQRDYGNECARVYYRIRTNWFNGATGFFDTTDHRDEFLAEIKSIYNEYGLKDETDRYNEPGNLYSHPQLISGVLYKNDIKRIGDVFEKAKTFKVEWVDVYETIYEMDDATYEKYMKSRDDEWRKYIFDHAGTTRTYKFYSAKYTSRRLANKYVVQRVGKEGDMLNSDNQTSEHFYGLIKSMVDDGLLIGFEEENDILYRTPNKTEQKKMKIKIA